DQRVLAGFGGLDRPLAVEGVRGGDIDRIDFRVGEERVITLEDARAAEIGGKAGTVGIAAGDGDELAGLRVRDAAVKRLGDAARPDDAPTQFAGRRHRLLLMTR